LAHNKLKDMKIIQRILFPIDFSETSVKALHQLIPMAVEWQADIHLVHAVFPQYEAMELPVLAAQATQERLQATNALLENLVDSLETEYANRFVYQPRFSSSAEIGNPIQVIADVAKRDGYELVAMGTRGEHNQLDTWMGSVASGVIRGVPHTADVLILPEHFTYKGIDTVVFAGSLAESDTVHLLEAARLMEPFSAVIHYVHVLSGTEDGMNSRLQKLADLLQHSTPALQVRYATHEAGDSTEGLNAYADLHQADLIVMTTHPKTIWERVFQTSHTRRMALHSKLPLLVLKSER
jgi:nucleotide-binding universal stress UspA family protein